MLGGIIGGLVTAWFLNLFGFYESIFIGFVSQISSFNPDIVFYYGIFAFIGMIGGMLGNIFKD